MVRRSTRSLPNSRRKDASKIYREKASGAQTDRRELLKLLKAIAPGDVVTVTRIDRLARSTFDLFAIFKQIVDAGGQFRSLAEPSRGIFRLSAAEWRHNSFLP